MTNIFGKAKRGLLDWLLSDADLRSYVVGAGEIGFADPVFGKDNTEFSPPEYGEYLMTSNGVYTCATIRADLLASLPLQVLKVDQGGGESEVEGQAKALLKKVNPFWTLGRLMKMTSYALDLWGVSFWFLERGESGRLPPREIWWARPDKVRVVPDETNYIKGFNYYPTHNAEPTFFTPEETIWIPNPNPMDELGGLAPLAAARLAADVASAGMKSNRDMFAQGIRLGGLLVPKESETYSLEQAKDLEKQIDKRFSGKDKAHKIGVLRMNAELKSLSISPKDAEFLGAMKWSLEEVSRAYRVPLDLIGGQRTYENVDASMKAVWTHAIKPLGRFLGEELTEKLLPKFPGEADMVAFDFSQIEVVQEERSKIVEQMVKLAEKGVPLNKLLKEFMPHLLPEGEEGYSWGDVWWAPAGTVPISSDQAPLTAVPPPREAGRAVPPKATPVENRGIELNSEEHERAWRRFERRTLRLEKRVAEFVAGLFVRQRDSVLDRLKGEKRSVEDAVGEPFDLNKWIKTFREEFRPELRELLGEVGEDELEKMGIAMVFNLDQPEVVRLMEQQAQRFAVEVNETTWDEITETLAEGLEEGEGLVKLEERIEEIFDRWLGIDPGVEEKLSRVEAIARTETVSASTGGSLEAMRQAEAEAGVKLLKGWLSALQAGRTRDSHAMAHMEYQENPIPLDEDFAVGAGSGPGPGQLGVASEDINCLCSLTYEVVEERGKTGYSEIQAGANGQREKEVVNYG